MKSFWSAANYIPVSKDPRELKGTELKPKIHPRLLKLNIKNFNSRKNILYCPTYRERKHSGWGRKKFHQNCNSRGNIKITRKGERNIRDASTRRHFNFSQTASGAAASSPKKIHLPRAAAFFLAVAPCKLLNSKLIPDPGARVCSPSRPELSVGFNFGVAAVQLPRELLFSSLRCTRLCTQRGTEEYLNFRESAKERDSRGFVCVCG